MEQKLVYCMVATFLSLIASCSALPGASSTSSGYTFRLLPWHSGVEPHRRSSLREVVEASSAHDRDKRAFCTLDLNCFLADKRSLQMDDSDLDEVAWEMCCTADQVCIYCDALESVQEKVNSELSKMLQRRIRRSALTAFKQDKIKAAAL